MPFKESVIHYKQKQKLCSLPGHQLHKNIVIVFGSYKRRKKDKSKFVTTFIRNDVKLSLYTNIPQLAGKIFATQCSFIHHLKQNCNKTSCKVLSANLRQLQLH